MAMSEIAVFAARRIVTMDPGRPTASAMAVRDNIPLRMVLVPYDDVELHLDPET
jgi:hypothetical protein